MRTIRKFIRKTLLESVSNEKRYKISIDIPADVAKIQRSLNANGYLCYVVGGAVRDAVYAWVHGKISKPKDFDLCTDASPDEITAALFDQDYVKDILPIGAAFGVMFVVTQSGEQFEIATFRSDIGKGRRPDSVKLEKSIEEDAKRRDLKFNALYYDTNTGEVIDLVGGVDDIKNNVVSTVGNPEDRFDEDPLRKLRVIRFSARLDSAVDSNADRALLSDNSLAGVSNERIRSEFLTGVSKAKSVIYFLNLVDRYGFFDWIFPGLKINKNFIEEKNHVILISSLLIGNNIESLKAKLNKLTYSTDEVSKIGYLVSFIHLSKDSAYEFKKLQPNSKLTDSEILKFAQWIGMDMALVDSFLKFNLTVKFTDLQNQGFSGRGKEIGDEIKKRETELFSLLF